MSIPSFSFVATPDGSGARHSLGITRDGKAFSWGKNNLGQLGRVTQTTTTTTTKTPMTIEVESESAFPCSLRFVKAYVGGFTDSGHSALLDSNGYLWLAGCDRWQQLGLGSSAGGSSGYTWNQGRVWRTKFVRNDFLAMKLQQQQHGSTTTIRDVALGGDHTVVLASNQKDVYVFGKGGDGQLGVDGKPFVSAPTRSKALSISSSSAENDNQATSSTKIAAVCAIQNCSLTLDDKANTMGKAGKCRSISTKALQLCIRRASADGLLSSEKNEE